MGCMYMVQMIMEISLLLVAFLAGITAAIAIGIVRDDFRGDCLIYAQVQYDTPNSFSVHANGTAPKCDFALAAQVIISLLGFLYALYKIIVFFTRRFDIPALRLIILPVYCIMCFISLIEACLVTVGFTFFCKQLTQTPIRSIEVECSRFQNAQWNVYQGKNFYVRLNLACIGSWISFACWLILVPMSIMVFVMDRRGTAPKPKEDPISMPNAENQDP
ncbi:transmembrane protein 179B-like [Diadema antillarum]|uniref:transmembrane protein 179B-like n=1 Tax=Diadema antillarum TaxID=105358 RepID=UPI003A8A9499